MQTFSGDRVSPLIVSDWTNNGGLGSPQRFFGDFCAYKSHPGVWGRVGPNSKHQAGGGTPADKHRGPGLRSPGSQIPKRLASDASYASVSKIMVTGPSFSEVTSISAPNSPCSTVKPRSRHRAIKASYRGIARSGLAAPVKPGRRLEVSA